MVIADTPGIGGEACMDMIMQERFTKLWARYSGKADVDIVFLHVNDPGGAEKIRPPKVEHKCVIAELAKARKGAPIFLDAAAIGCFGGKRYLGFTGEFRPNFEYFLSFGIPGGMEGKRYKKSSEDVLSCLFIFANYDQVDPNGAFSPFAAGCATIVNYPYTEKNAEYPRGGTRNVRRVRPPLCLGGLPYLCGSHEQI
jgi:hypothetical protein